MAVRVDGCRIVTGYSGAIKTLLANSGCKHGHQDVNTVNIANIGQLTRCLAVVTVTNVKNILEVNVLL